MTIRKIPASASARLCSCRITAAIFAASLVTLFTGCTRAPQWHVAEGAVWNTTYRIVYHSPVSLDDSIQLIFKQIERSLSPFDPQSAISRINRGETDRTDPLIDTVFSISRRVSALSGGRFDPTVSPLVNLWGFGYDRQARRRAETDSAFTVPQEMIDSALSMVGIGQCSVAGGRITKKHPATTFNFSAVTKGFACDMMAAMLRRNGSADNMVEIGGEIAVTGRNQQGKPWKIQIDAPLEAVEPEHTPLRCITVTDCGIATSGNYRNFHDTRRYGRIGHTIDPVSGMPAHTDVAAATVTAPTAALADALATACMASDASAAMKMIEETDSAECLLVVHLPDTLVVSFSKGFHASGNTR